ncbi:MAG: FAD-dependent oxidoreductase [Pseudomonadota bacterium]
MPVEVRPEASFDYTVDVLIIGAGACGLTAALASADEGASVLILERDASPAGTSAMSTGLIPAAATPEQAEAGIPDTVEHFAADMIEKAGGQSDTRVVERLAAESAETVMWLRSSHNVPLSLVDGFLYPGHRYRRMYGTPNRTGSELIAALASACGDAGVDILTDAYAETLITDRDQAVRGVRFQRPDGGYEEMGCQTLILATCGFAGNAEMVAQWMPEMSGAVFHGHPGADGSAVHWGAALDAQLGDMTGYQGHGGLAYGHGVPILWPTIMRGGFQVNREGARFSDETLGYSEQAAKILQQPEGAAWTIFDQTIEDVMLQFDDYQDALQAGAIKTANSIGGIAEIVGLSTDGLMRTFAVVETHANGNEVDVFGRRFHRDALLKPPFKIVRVSGAIFHTQGGLEVDEDARVIRQDGRPFPNLYAGGGAARGISGPNASGYMAGNGLLTATGLGKIAGRHAAKQAQSNAAP